MSTLLLTDLSGFDGAPAADLALAAAVYQFITKFDEHYRGHQWLVNADHGSGIVTVKLLYLDKLGRNGK